jgi:hypothetical protein
LVYCPAYSSNCVLRSSAATGRIFELEYMRIPPIKCSKMAYLYQDSV